MTQAQQTVLDTMNANEITHIDADSRGVAHLLGKTVNGNLLSALITAGVMSKGTQPGCGRWRYTLIQK